MVALLLRWLDAARIQTIIWWLLCAAYLGWAFWEFELTSFDGTGITITSVCGGLAIILWVVMFIMKPSSVRVYQSAFWTIVLFLVVVVALTSFVRDGAPTYVKTIKTTSHLFIVFGMMFSWALLEMPSRNVARLFRYWIWLSVPICLFGIYQIYARIYQLPFAWIELTNSSLRAGNQDAQLSQLSLKFGNFWRATSIFGEPSALGLFCTFTLVMLFTAFVAGLPALYIKSGVARTIVFTLLFVTLFLTYSLSGMITTGAFIAFMVVSLDRKRRLIVLRRAVLGVCIFLIFDFAVLVPTMGQSISMLIVNRADGIITAQLSGNKQALTMGESFGSRVFSMREGARIWSNYPLVGAGLGRYGELTIGFPYNDTFYFRMLAELGILGLLVMLMFLGSVTIQLFRTTRRLPIRSPDWVVVRTLGYLLGLHVVLGWMTDFFLSEIFWANMGMALLVLKDFSTDPRKVISLKV